MIRRFRLIANPASGSGRAGESAVDVAGLLAAGGAEAYVEHTTDSDTVAKLVEGAVAAGEIVVAVGGDGMIASVAGAVSDADGVLGIVPAGSGNDFARSLGVPTDPVRAARVLLEGVIRRVDLIRYTVPGHEPCRVVGSVYVGFDARNSLVANQIDWAPRERKYEFAAIHHLMGFESDEVELTVDGTTTRRHVAELVIASSPYFGGGFPIAPGADVADGMLDIVVSEAADRRALMETLLALPQGAHVDRADVHRFRGRQVTLRGLAADGSPVPVGGDGEPLPDLPSPSQDPARINVLPAALTVLVEKVTS